MLRMSLVGEAEGKNWNDGRQHRGNMNASSLQGGAVLRNSKVQDDKEEDDTPWKWAGPGPAGSEATFPDRAACLSVTTHSS